ncbi:MAG: aspartate carbamoyltransferase catalytic subunit [Streptococcaceae bacterium]|jgi:aspartate carbamoyltransferase catalytic subunit|nr:aspartate carbamoyltransferase catalytic subunit [Streptococcaceae bacterium]
MTLIAKIDHFVSVEDLTNEQILLLLKRASAFKQKDSWLWDSPKKQIFAANLFFENSTRTHNSFYIAQRKLGMDVLELDVKTSSLQKGETLYDTLVTLSALGVNVVVIRSNVKRYWENLINAPIIDCHVVNGGDGSGGHPSQCLLDLMTIQEEFGAFSDLRVAIVGDLIHSRVARSNMQMLTRFGAKIIFSGPKEWHNEEFDHYGQFLPLDDLIDKVDVLMMLRVQHERHNNQQNFSKEEYHKLYGLTKERAKRLQKRAIIMHPAPINRDVEIASVLVESPKSKIVEQMKNGVYARMAILEAVMSSR